MPFDIAYPPDLLHGGIPGVRLSGVDHGSGRLFILFGVMGLTAIASGVSLRPPSAAKWKWG
jgi:hypothetical protein